MKKHPSKTQLCLIIWFWVLWYLLQKTYTSCSLISRNNNVDKCLWFSFVAVKCYLKLTLLPRSVETHQPEWERQMPLVVKVLTSQFDIRWRGLITPFEAWSLFATCGKAGLLCPPCSFTIMVLSHYTSWFQDQKRWADSLLSYENPSLEIK